MPTPLVSVITPVYKPRLSELEHCLASVRTAGVEHVLVIDGPENVENLDEIRRLARRHEARLVVRPERGGISNATNTGAEAASGEFLVLVDQDDFLEPRWFDHFKAAADDADMLYSDMYTAEQSGRKVRSYLKPAWSPVRLTFNMFACHFLALRRSLFISLGGMRPDFDGAQDHDIALRFSRNGARVKHIPVPLYNWRQSATSTALNPESKPYAFTAGQRAAQEHLDELGIEATVAQELIPGSYVAHFPRRKNAISVVIPTAFGRDKAKHAHVQDAVESLYKHLGLVAGDELILVSGGEDDHGLVNAIDEAASFNVKHVIDNGKFNFSRRSNIGFENASNELVLLMNDDVVLDSDPCLDQMVGLLSFPNVGLVGGLLVFPGLQIQHGGHIYNDRPGHAYYRFNRLDAPLFDLMIDREVSGVTAALTLQKKSTWQAVGGFCEALPLNFNDVDYCLKIATLGYSAIQANSSRAVHHESVTREPTVIQWEIDFIRARWRDALTKDKFTRNVEATIPHHPEWTSTPQP